MEIFSNPFSGSIKRYRRRRGYKRLDGRKSTKTIRIGGGPKRSWRIKVAPRLRLKMAFLSPLKLWGKLKNTYVNMMLNLAGSAGNLNNRNLLARKRNPKAREIHSGYSVNEFENRLAFEIYKALVASS